jgi:hypothetical protein
MVFFLISSLKGDSGTGIFFGFGREWAQFYVFYVAGMTRTDFNTSGVKENQDNYQGLSVG